MIRNVISLSEKGLRRQDNQDAVLVANTGCAGFFVVADGMGGHYRGELASQMAVSLLGKWWDGIRECIAAMPFPDIVMVLEKKVREINRNIYQMYYELGQAGGTTLCLLLVQGEAYAVINVGDSRLYRCEGRTCMQVTADDVGPYADGLTQALGAQEGLAVHIFTGTIRKKAYFFLCSDGIYKYCREQYLFSKLRCLSWNKNTAVAGQIRKKVYQNGAKDNLSMVIVTVEAEKG